MLSTPLLPAPLQRDRRYRSRDLTVVVAWRRITRRRRYVVGKKKNKITSSCRTRTPRSAPVPLGVLDSARQSARGRTSLTVPVYCSYKCIYFFYNIFHIVINFPLTRTRPPRLLSAHTRTHGSATYLNSAPSILQHRYTPYNERLTSPTVNHPVVGSARVTRHGQGSRVLGVRIRVVVLESGIRVQGFHGRLRAGFLQEVLAG